MIEDPRLLYCPTCMVEQQVIEFPTKEALELYCNKCHSFMTRLISNKIDGYDLDRSVYDKRPDKKLEDVMPQGKGGTIKLTKEDIKKLKNGKILDYHFHGTQFHKAKIAFLVGYDKANISPTSPAAKKYRNESDVCPLRIEKDQMKMIESGENVIGRQVPCSPPFDVTICTEQQYQELLKKHD